MMVQIKKAGLIIAAGVLSGSLSMTSFGAGNSGDYASSFSSRFSLGEVVGDYDDGDDPEADVANGPGAMVDTGNGSIEEGDGPGIEEVNMGERFHADFDLYELSIKDKYFLYSNVSNGGITDKPVYLELPAGVDYKAEKDGVSFPYSSRQMVSEKGTYVIRITAVADKNVPLSEQKEYRAVFRFRIDDKTPEALAAEAAAAAGGSSGGIGGYASGWAEETDGDVWNETEASQTEAPETADEAESGAGDESQDGAESRGQDGTEDRGEDETGTETEPESQEETQPAVMRRTQVFMPEEGMYQVTLENGFTFMCNIPERMLSTQAVTIRSGESYQLFLGDEEQEWQEELLLRAYGSYRLVSGGYEFTFEITDTYVNRDSYRAPAGLRIVRAEFNGQSLDVGDGGMIAMNQDGSYKLELAGEAGDTFTVSLERDTQPPEVTVDVGRQKVVITYLSQDLAGITLSKNGREPYEFTGTEVTGPGKYLLTVKDRAGNETVSEFALQYHMNFYALAAIVLCLAGIVTAIVLLVRKKKNLTVR